MKVDPQVRISFARLPEISPEELIAHMSDARVAEHMPLLTSQWDRKRVDEFVAAKEACWLRDGLGHWAILVNGDYAGWGGFQKEGTEWDFGLVLKSAYFGFGWRITRQAIVFALTDERIAYVTFLLPPTRKNLGALSRHGAEFVGEVDYDGTRFLKYRLDTM